MKKACRRFPKPAGGDLFGGSPGVSPGVARNFQVFDALDFIAQLTQHIPDPGPSEPACPPWDLDNDGSVSVPDLVMLLTHLGPCP